MAATSVWSLHWPDRDVCTQLSAETDATVSEGPRRTARFRSRLPVARVGLQSAACHQTGGTGAGDRSDRKPGVRRSANGRRRSDCGQEGRVKEQKPKVADRCTEAGTVLLPVL